MVSSGDSSLAERRRLRKLENQRLEEAARQRQEELKAQQEADRKRQEDEKLAEEQRRLQEREEIVKKRREEAQRIANIEHEERQAIGNIEKQLRLVGAFWKSTLELPLTGNETALPLCATVLTAKSLEIPIQGVEDDIIFVADNAGKVHAYDRKARSRLFSSASESFALHTPSAMITTRCGRLLICDQECSRVALIELRVLFQLYRTALLSIHARDGNPVEFDATTARKIFFGGISQVRSPRGLAVDDAAGEIYVSDATKNCIRVYKIPKGITVPKGSGEQVDRSIADDPAKCILKRPGGLDISHYHIVVCDVGNSRLVVFAKRGAFVLAMGCKGMNMGEFYDVRDVKLANVRKRAITRGVQAENEVGVWNEHFDAIVADCGNFRVQILNERGEFLRQLSMLGSVEQVTFQREQFARLRAEIAREYTKLRQTPPALSGESMKNIDSLATVLHPSCQLYARLTTYQMEWRQRRSRFHHPFALAYGPSEKEIIVVDRENASVYTYSFDPAGCNWLQLPKSQTEGVRSVHSSLQLNLASFDIAGGDDQPVQNLPMKQWLFVSDPIAHRVAVFDMNDMTLKFFIGATTYGDQQLCSNGFLPGELNTPTFLTAYTEELKNDAMSESNEKEVLLPRNMLVVSDSGNHSVSIFDARNGSFYGRIGEGFGHLDGFLDTPQGVAVWDNRLLYVCDQHNHRVQVFDLVTRQLVRMFGRIGTSPGEFNFPTGLAICPGLPEVPKCDFGPHRYAKIVVADTGNCRVQVLDLNGCPQLVLDAKNTPFDQPLSPVGVWVQQRSGYLLVSDAANCCVAIFTNCGNFLTAFGATGEIDARFMQPMGIVIASQTTDLELLLVTDAMRCDVSSFQLKL